MSTTVALEKTPTWNSILENQQVMTRKERFLSKFHRYSIPVAATTSTVSAILIFS